MKIPHRIMIGTSNLSIKIKYDEDKHRTLLKMAVSKSDDVDLKAEIHVEIKLTRWNFETIQTYCDNIYVVTPLHIYRFA